ncbi:hypothetical protein [Priestia flexa]|uniref:hypothetical protein n=1 Tax=Priestia flexa TaxID=86664 RepID=UPI000473C46A|nr:hypothetical protein [Priestia flexa]
MSKEQYVKQELEIFKTKYEWSHLDDFSVKAMFELQWQYFNSPIDHVKTRSELLNMIENIKRRLDLKPVVIKPELKNENKFIIGIFVNNDLQVRQIHETFLTDMKENITFFSSEKNKAAIHTKTKIYKIFARTNDEILRGITIHDYWNLTGDKQFDRLIRSFLNKF